MSTAFSTFSTPWWTRATLTANLRSTPVEVKEKKVSSGSFFKVCRFKRFHLCAGDPESVAGEYGRHSLYKMLGYFSLVGLLRLHSLLGDYYQAIKVLENIELNKKVELETT